MNRALILVVDDESGMRRAYGRVLRGSGYAVSEAESGIDALRQMQRGLRPDVVLLDYLMPNMRGDQVLRAIRALAPQLPVIICSGEMNAQLEESLNRAGAHACVDKPLLPYSLRAVIESALPTAMLQTRW